MYGNLSYRIASSAGGLAKGYFFCLGLPPPQNLEYKDHSLRAPQGDGAEIKHGYKSVAIIWDRLTLRQAYLLKSRVDNSADLYLTFDRLDGTKPGRGWVDAYGKPSLSDMTPVSPITKRGAVYNTVTLTINNLTILNDPAQF